MANNINEVEKIMTEQTQELLNMYIKNGVCPRCYNPKIHLPPDTSGD